jgi:XTP/dITP diphosphohydrolase
LKQARVCGSVEALLDRQMRNMALKVVLATRNRGKVRELQDHLSGLGWEILTLDQFPRAPTLIEDGNTFQENARKKAQTIARALGLWALGEDSGLVVDALGGAPGVFSACFAGPNATDEENNRKLLELMREIPPEQRTAHYECHLVLADPEGAIRAEASGQCHGLIATEPRGREGFGYDPLFVVPEYHRTFAELGLVAKRYLSHRARACEQLRRAVKKLGLGHL